MKRIVFFTAMLIAFAFSVNAQHGVGRNKSRCYERATRPQDTPRHRLQWRDCGARSALWRIYSSSLGKWRIEN
jgi:hypothetical protein